MRKTLNRPVDHVDETPDGLCAAHPGIYAQPGPRVIARASGATPGKVGLVTGDGSGHLPVFGGHVGTGPLDAAAMFSGCLIPTAL